VALLLHQMRNMKLLTTFILVAIATLAVAYKNGDNKKDIQADHWKDEIASLSKEEAREILEEVFDELDDSEDDVKQDAVHGTGRAQPPGTWR